MALLIKPDGRVLCAAMHNKENEDIYIEDSISYYLTVVEEILVTDKNHCVVAEDKSVSGHGQWWWRDKVPKDVTIYIDILRTVHYEKRCLAFITSIRKSDRYIQDIYTSGGCYQFYLILKTQFSFTIPYITKGKDHVVSKVGKRLYDINGRVSKKDEDLYVLMTKEDEDIAKKWSFSKHMRLWITECPACEEPITI